MYNRFEYLDTRVGFSPIVEFVPQYDSVPSQDGRKEEAPTLSVCPRGRGQQVSAKAQYSSSLKKKSSFEG